MKKAFILKIINYRHLNKPKACREKLPLFGIQNKLINFPNITKIGENSLPPRGAKELIENTAKSMSLYAALLLRVGVRGQQAFISRHLDSCHSELVSGSATYQNWRKLPPPKGEGRGEGSTSVYKAFTLVEVLITLAIIGVVAAMAIPSVISNASLEIS